MVISRAALPADAKEWQMKYFLKTCYSGPVSGAASFALLAALVFSAPAAAHFQTIIPSDDIVTAEEPREIALDMRFFHPFEGHVMEMAPPARFGMLARGETLDLLPLLQQKSIDGMSAYEAKVEIKRPGDVVFYVEPAPYWEPAEDVFIVHYTKTVVNALGLESGWDAEVGLKAEIVPLTRPYGLWTGNVFTGVVKFNGKPAPGVPVEVEYFNIGGVVKAPADPFIAQVVKTDANGVFAYAMPRAGWWGFAALGEDDRTLTGPDGAEKHIEIGAVLWVRTVDMGGD